MKMRFDFFYHIIILIVHDELHRAFAVPVIEYLRRHRHLFLAMLEQRTAVVADNILHLRLLHGSLHGKEMEKAFPALRAGRHFGARQEAVEFHGRQHRIDHDILRRTRMYIDTSYGDLGTGRVEILVYDLSLGIAVYRVGKIRTECLQVKMIGAVSDFLIRCKGDADPAMRYVLLQNLLRRCEDLRDAGFVIRAEHRGAVCHNQRSALHIGKHRELPHFNRPAAAAERYVTAVIILYDTRIHMCAAEIRHGIHMGNQSDCRCILAPGRRRYRAVHIAAVIDAGIFYAHRLHLIDELSGQIELVRRRRRGLAGLAAHRIKRHIF